MVEDGTEALNYLHRRYPYTNAHRPDLILLDLNLPRKSGQEVLAEIKQHERFKRIPVIVLSSSSMQEDVHRAYGAHANCYVVKPVNFYNYSQVVQQIESFWSSIPIYAQEDELLS